MTIKEITEDDLIEEQSDQFFQSVINAYNIGKNDGSLIDIDNMLKEIFKKG